jgi:hypothetical protein
MEYNIDFSLVFAILLIIRVRLLFFYILNFWCQGPLRNYFNFFCFYFQTKRNLLMTLICFIEVFLITILIVRILFERF